MTAAVRSAINGLVAGGRRPRHEADPRSIFELVFVSNPVMHHLLLGIDPVELGQAPFALATSSALSFDATEIDIDTVQPGGAGLCAALHRRPCRCRLRRGGAVRAARQVEGHCSDRRCRHQCRTASGQRNPGAGLFLANRPRLRGCADLVGPARRPRRHRAGRDRPRDQGAAVQGHRLRPVERPIRVSPRPSRAPGSPASAARASSRRWPRCGWRASSTRAG